VAAKQLFLFHRSALACFWAKWAANSPRELKAQQIAVAAGRIGWHCNSAGVKAAEQRNQVFQTLGEQQQDSFSPQPL